MFGVQRIGSGPWTNPHAAEWFNRLRLVLITAGKGFTLEKSPVQVQDNPDEYMLSAQPGTMQFLNTVQASGDSAPSDAAPTNPVTDGDSDSSADDAEEVAIQSEDDDDHANDPTGSPDFGEHLDQDTYQDLFEEEGNNASANEDSDSEDDEARLPGELLLPAMTPEECSENALITVAGWLAFEVRDKYPQFADQTREIPVTELPPWLARLSRGGLSYPREDFLRKFKLMKADFDAYHGGPKEVSYRRKIKANFLQILQSKYPELPKVVLTKFTNFHTHLRMRYLNTLRRQAAEERREERRAARKRRQYVS